MSANRTSWSFCISSQVNQSVSSLASNGVLTTADAFWLLVDTFQATSFKFKQCNALRTKLCTGEIDWQIFLKGGLFRLFNFSANQFTQWVHTRQLPMLKKIVGVSKLILICLRKFRLVHLLKF